MSEKKGNIIVAGLWKTRNGHFNTMTLDNRAIEALSAAEVGGKFVIRLRTEEAISKAKNPETTPVAYLEFVTKEGVKEFEQSKASRKGL